VTSEASFAFGFQRNREAMSGIKLPSVKATAIIRIAIMVACRKR
jgi:hypothetical protein